MSTSDLICVKDYESRALALLDTRYADFYSTGADDEQTLTDNEADFKRLRLRPRVLVDVSNISLTTSILGEKISFPVCIAPSSKHKLAHPLGESATAKGACQVGTCMCVSVASTTSIDQLASDNPSMLGWFQLYIFKKRELTIPLIKRAENAGFKALVVTADVPEVGNRRRRTRNNFELPHHLRLENLVGIANTVEECAYDPPIDNSLSWKDLEWIISVTKLPVVLKGILTGEDAERAINAGCSAIYVSNHGGRQLDGTYSSIAALSEVVEAVEGRVEVYVDGGFRTGTDVLKALALGARAVFVGRPVLYGLAVKGEEGVTNILKLFRDELKLAMQLSGVTDVQSIPKGLVTHQPYMAKL